MKKQLTEPHARDFMQANVVTIRSDMDLNEAARVLLNKGVSNAPVVKEEGGKSKLVGFLSERDCLQFLSNEIYYNIPAKSVATMMKIHPVCVKPDTDIFTLASVFLQHGFRHLPVCEEGYLCGIVSRRDVLRSLMEVCNESETLQELQKNRPDMSKLVNHRFIVI